MRSELLDGRRLRFPVEMGDHESIPGAIVRGVRQHVLVRTAPVLEAAGVDLRHAGLAQIASAEELERLAFVTRCPANDFITRAGERLVRPDDDKSYEARFGRLVIPRAYLEFNRRRIGPTTLQGDAYHRASWMNALLPYCPESLERLVDSCSHCDTKLGWFHTQGVGHCDQCGKEVVPSAEQSLPDALADDYRLFALLSSPSPQGVEEACMQMPSSLSDLSPGSLLRLALLVGGIVQPEPVATTNRNTVISIPAPVLASVVASGAAHLRSWPTGFRSWVAGQMEELRGTPANLTALRARLKRLANRMTEPEDMVAAVVAAMPDLRQHVAHGFSVDRPYYLYKHVQRILGLNSPAMDALKKWPGIKFLKLNDGGKEQGQFDVEQIDMLHAVFRESVFIGSCASHFDLPIYAVEQLCAGEILEWEDHAALLATTTAVKVRGSSIRRLEEKIASKARLDQMPNDCVSLAVAAKRIGGRLKPWASIVKALRTGSLSFWRPNGDFSIPSLRVRAKDLAAFQTIVDTEAPEGMTVSAVCSQKDAAEILNTSAENIAALTIKMGFPFERHGKGLAASRTAVLAAADSIAFNAEVALHENVHYRTVCDILTARGINPLHMGWKRVDLVREGILPRFPAP